LRSVSRDERIIRAILTPDYGTLSPRERALVDYAVRLTVTPAQMQERDVASLRKNGLDDVAILHACQIVAYFNFVNRLAHGLGVHLES